MTARQSFITFWLFIGALAVFHCNNNVTERYSGTTSACGGFKAFSKRASSTPSFKIDSASYSEAERLWWQYDPARDYLSLLHTRIILNCDAKLSITGQMDGNTVIVNETDAAKDSGGSAACSCTFDTYLEVPDVKPGFVSVNISSKVFSIDTREGTGVFVLDSLQDSASGRP